MPLADYQCATCGGIQADVYFPMERGARANPPLCCGEPMEWIPQIGAMDAYEPGQEFTVMDGRNQPRTVESLRDIRKIEKESEQQARNGEGQQMVWRKYAQDASNVHTHTLAADPSQSPERRAAERFGLRRSSHAPEHSFGPGVNDSNTSALRE